jgi:hypothetical protein
MNKSEIKKLIVNSMDPETNTVETPEMLELSGVSYNFSESFGDKVLDKLFSAGITFTKQVEFVKYMNFAFYRVALTGIAAIIILLISIFLKEGSLSFNSFLGLNDNYDESIIALLTGK